MPGSVVAEATFKQERRRPLGPSCLPLHVLAWVPSPLGALAPLPPAPASLPPVPPLPPRAVPVGGREQPPHPAPLLRWGDGVSGLSTRRVLWPLGSGAAPSTPGPWGSLCTTDGRALVLSEASYQSYRLHVRMGGRLLSLFQKRHWREMRLEQKQETLRSVREETQLVRRRKP